MFSVWVGKGVSSTRVYLLFSTKTHCPHILFSLHLMSVQKCIIQQIRSPVDPHVCGCPWKKCSGLLLKFIRSQCSCFESTMSHLNPTVLGFTSSFHSFLFLFLDSCPKPGRAFLVCLNTWVPVWKHQDDKQPLPKICCVGDVKWLSPHQGPYFVCVCVCVFVCVCMCVCVLYRVR